MNINDDEALGLINRLLERLHQADLKSFGSHLQIVYVASGGQHVDTQINIGASPQCIATPHSQIENATLSNREPLPRGKGVDSAETSKSMPDVLATDKAMVMWKKAQEAGYVDENFQPLISRTQAALLADAMAERLGIKEKWKVFEGFWNRKYMRSDYNLALTQQQSYDFMDEIKQVLG